MVKGSTFRANLWLQIVSQALRSRESACNSHERRIWQRLFGTKSSTSTAPGGKEFHLSSLETMKTMISGSFRWNKHRSVESMETCHMMTSTPGTSHMVRLFPRRKMNDDDRESRGYNQRERQPHLFDASAIADYFCFVQVDAARKLGISVTTLKKVCRKVGIERWPGPRRRCHRETRSWDDAPVQSNPNPIEFPARNQSASKSHNKNQQHRDPCRLSRFHAVHDYLTSISCKFCKRDFACLMTQTVRKGELIC